MVKEIVCAIKHVVATTQKHKLQSNFDSEEKRQIQKKVQKQKDRGSRRVYSGRKPLAWWLGVVCRNLEKDGLRNFEDKQATLSKITPFGIWEIVCEIICDPTASHKYEEAVVKRLTKTYTLGDLGDFLIFLNHLTKVLRGSSARN